MQGCWVCASCDWGLQWKKRWISLVVFIKENIQASVQTTVCEWSGTSGQLRLEPHCLDMRKYPPGVRLWHLSQQTCYPSPRCSSRFSICPYPQSRHCFWLFKSRSLTKQRKSSTSQWGETQWQCACVHVQIEQAHPKTDSERSECWIPSYLVPMPGTDTTSIPFPHHLQRKKVSGIGFVDIYKIPACGNAARVTTAPGWCVSEEVCKGKAGRRLEETLNTCLTPGRCGIES